MHYKEAKSILSANNGMNLYRGCSHGCIYCDSRSECYQINHLFDDIEIKENAINLLEDKLKRKRKPCMIGTGSMSDPYIPIEQNIHYTRQALELINKYNCGISIQTKSNKILNDLDILKEINNKSKCVVSITMTTYDESLCKKLEPNVSTTKERFEVLKILRDNNIPTIVWLSPILPFINDNIENIKGILDYCIEAKVYGIICFGMGMTLRKGNREYYYQQLDKLFPNLKEKYIKVYKDDYEVNSIHNKELMDYFYKRCKENNIVCNNNELFDYMHKYPENKLNNQISLF
jgi:DNA repair photolyase